MYIEKNIFAIMPDRQICGDAQRIKRSTAHMLLHGINTKA